MKRLCLALCFLFAATLSASTQEKIVATTILRSTVTAAGQPIVFPTAMMRARSGRVNAASG